MAFYQLKTAVHAKKKMIQDIFRSFQLFQVTCAYRITILL